MKKAISCFLRHKVATIVSILALGLATFFLWPHSLGDAMESPGDDYSISTVGVDMMFNGSMLWDGELMWTVEEFGGHYILEADSEASRAIEEILQGYNFYYTLRSWGEDTSMAGNPLGYYLFIDIGDCGLTVSGTGEVRVNDRIYRLGLWGDGASFALVEEVEAVLATCIPIGTPS